MRRLAPAKLLPLVLLASAVLGVPSRSAAADIMMPGWRRVQVDVTIDHGVFTAWTTWRYETKEGDTLESIAKVQLGAESRKADIVALNPKIAAPLVPKTRVIMPPKPAQGKGPREIPWWDLIYMGGGGGPVTMPEPFYPNEPFPHGGYGRIYAVPHDLTAKVIKDMSALASHPAVASGEFAFGGSARDSDPTERIVSRYLLEMTGDRTLVLKLLEQKRLGKDGRVLSRSMGGPAPIPMGGTPPWFFVLVGAGAFGGLALLAVRRRRGGPASAVAS